MLHSSFLTLIRIEHSNVLLFHRCVIFVMLCWFFSTAKSCHSLPTNNQTVEASWNVMTHAQKPDFVFRRNGRVHLNRWGGGRQFSRLLAAEVCASVVVMLDTSCSEVVWRVLATHSIRQFPLHVPSRASPCAITSQLESTTSCRQSATAYSVFFASITLDRLLHPQLEDASWRNDKEDAGTKNEEFQNGAEGCRVKICNSRRISWCMVDRAS